MICPPLPIAAYVLTLPLQKADQLISTDFNNTPLRSALETLFKSAGIKNYVIDNGVTGTVTLKTTGQPFDKLIALLQRAATQPFLYQASNGVVVVTPRPAQTSTSGGGGGQGRLPAIPEGPLYPITVRYRTLDELETVLGGIVRLADSDPLSEKPAPVAKAPAGINPMANMGGGFGSGFGGGGGFGGGLSARQRRQLSGAGSGALRPPGVDAIYALANGTLLVQGDKAEIEELARRLKTIDVPTPTLEYRIEVVAVGSGKGGRSTLLSAVESGKCGREITALSKFSGTPAQTSRIEVALVATPLGDNYFEVESRWDASVPLLGTLKGQLIRLEKSFSNTRRVRAGETMMFGGVILKEEQGAVKGGQEVLFFLTLKPI
jgi:hypothetical protein